MAVTEDLIDALMLAARGGIRVTEMTINGSAYRDALLEPSAQRAADEVSFTLNGPLGPVVVRKADSP